MEVNTLNYSINKHEHILYNEIKTLFYNSLTGNYLKVTDNNKSWGIWIGKKFMPLSKIDGSKEYVYIPLQMTRSEKTSSYYPTLKRTVAKDWAWAHPTYSFEVNKSVKSVSIDPAQRMADINPKNNVYNK